ncbi:hypothetical protein [Zhongshania marina]|nr:hypothetical protein [Marortus luteolus]
MTKFNPIESGLGYCFGFIGGMHLLPGLLAQGHEFLFILFLGIALAVCTYVYQHIGCLGEGWKGKLLVLPVIFNGLLLFIFVRESMSEIERSGIIIIAIIIYVVVYWIFVHKKLKTHLSSTGGGLWK